MAGFLAGFGQGLLDYSNQLNNNAYRQALLQLNQQNQQLRARQVLAELANQKRQQDTQALFGRAISGAMAQPSAASLGQDQPPQSSGMPSIFPQVPDATGQMAAPESLKRQVLALEGNRDVIGRAGEIGPGQIMPATGEQYGYAPSQLWGDSGRQASGRIVDDLFRRSGGDPAATLVGYNRGPGAMRQFQAAGDNPAALKTPLAPDYQKAVEADLSPEARQQGGQVAVGAAGMLPPQMVGRGGPDIFARLVERVAGSDAPDDVKGAALMQLLPLMSQEGQRSFQQAFEMYRLGTQQAQHREDVEERRQDRAAGLAQTRELAEERMQTSRDLAAQRQEANPNAVALQKFLEEHPNATGEEIQAFNQRGRSARSGPAMAAQKYLQEHPDATSDEIRNFVAQTAAQTATTRQFDVGKQGDTVRSLNVAIDHLAVLQDAADALQNGDTKRLNQVGNIISKELGYPAPTEFGAVKSIVKDELVKAVLGGAGALGDRQEVEQQLDAANSPEQMMGVIRRYEQLMGGQMRGLKQQFMTSGAGDEGAFNQKLLPRTQEVLKRAGSPAEQQQGGGHKVGEIIEKGGKRWRVIGGDPNDPDVEPAQ